MIGKPQAGLPSGMAGMGDDFPTLPRRDVILTLAGVMLALFLSALDQTIVATALPSIVLDLGGFDRLTWITTSYLVASTTAVPIAGRLSDMYGRKWFFVIGIVIFLVGSVLAGLSQSMNQLIVFRAIQGIGGGVMMANAFTTIADIFPPAERGKYMGFMTGVFGVAAILGPLLGGLITDGISWHWIFYVNVPIAIPVLFLFIKYFPDAHVQRTEHNIDYLGVLLLISGVVPLLIGLAWADVEYAWGSVQVIGALAFGTVMLIALVWWETKAEEPIIQLQMFKSRLIAVSLFIIFLTGFAMFGAIIFIPLYFQAVLGASASASGTFLTPMMLGMVFGATISGQALSRLGGHYPPTGNAWAHCDDCGGRAANSDIRDYGATSCHWDDRSVWLRNGDYIPALHNRHSEHGPSPYDGNRHLVHAVLPVDRRHYWAGDIRLVLWSVATPMV